MQTHCKENIFDFSKLGNKNIEAAFDGGRITSDAGAILLREIEKKFKVIDKFSKCFTDYRNPEKIEHTLNELLAQRIFGICLGYEDLNDHDILRNDPLLALICEKEDPFGNDRINDRDKGKGLAGKSTLNRIELSKNDDLSKERYKRIHFDFEKIESFFVEIFLSQHKKPLKEIIIDLDATDDKIHGNQEGRFFHGYYDCYCYLPLYIFCGDDLLGAKLRPSNIDASLGAKEEIERIVSQIREKWTNVRITIRGDSGFCRNEIMSWCEENNVYYIFGHAKNSRLLEMTIFERINANIGYMKTKKATRIFVELKYKTIKTWPHERRVVCKAEHLEKGENPRFIVTNIPEEEIEAKELYEKIYCARGEMENRIKEQQLELFADRTSSATMRANQLRLWYSSVAYAILNIFREYLLKDTKYSEIHCETIRLKFLKIGAQIKQSVRRFYISFSESYVLKDWFIKISEKIKNTGPLYNI
jgi:hypothetical protein